MPSTGSSSSVPLAEAPPPNAEVVIGLTSYNNAATVPAVVRRVREALEAQSVPASVVLADGGSTDQTLNLAREALDGVSELVVRPYLRPTIDPLKSPFHGLPGRPDAVRVVLTEATERGASACAILDAGLTSLTATWVDRLLSPVLSGSFDYVSAYYARRPAEGAITKSIVYPVFRTLYGARLRQPAAAEFGCSASLMSHYLEQVPWTAEGSQAGIDLWLTSAAVAGEFRICEAALGVRAQAPRPGAPDLSTTLTQIVGALFLDVEAHADRWQRMRATTPVVVVGELPVQLPPPRDVDPTELIDAFRLGYSALRDVWAWILPPKTIMQLKRLADTPAPQFRVPDEIWARIIYDFALGHRVRALPRDHLLGSLTPLYLGWLASFILEMDEADGAAGEARLERLCLAFEAEKPYLISRWRWPERFRS